MSYIEALLDLNIEGFVKPTDIKVLTYGVGDSKLIRLLHPAIVVHPRIEWNSSASSLIVSPTPIAIRDGNSIRIVFYELEGRKRVLELEAMYDTYYLDPLSLALVVPNSDTHKVLSPLGEKPLKSKLRFFLPCTNESYILTEESLDVITYWDRKTIVKKPHIQTFSVLHPYLGMTLNALAVHNNGTMIVSDGIYGSKTVINEPAKYLDGASQLYLLNDFSIAVTSRNHSIVIETRYGNARILPRGLIPFIKEGPYVIGLFKPNNYIALYHLSKNELQSLFPSTCKLLTYNFDSDVVTALCIYASRYMLIVTKLTGEGLAMELPSEPLNVEIIDDLLMISYTDKSEIYRVSQNLDRIELLCVTKPLYNCRRLDDRRVVCIDAFGRLMVVNIKRLCDRPKFCFLRSKESTCIELDDTSKYVSILGASTSNPIVRRLSLTRTIIELENPGYQRLQLTISGTVYDTSLLLNGSQPVYAKHDSKDSLSNDETPKLTLIKSNAKLYVYNDGNSLYCIFDPQSINYVEREFMVVPQGIISKMYRVHRASHSPRIEFWKKVDPTSLRYIELPKTVEIVLSKDLICVPANLPANAREYRLEIELICEEGVFTLKDKCISTDVCRNLLAALICIVLGDRQRYCTPISTPPRVVIAESESMELTVKRILNDIYMTIPKSCTFIDGASLIINKNFIPVLMLNVINRCDIPITIVSVHASSIQRISLGPYQDTRVYLPIDSLIKLFRKPMIIVFELSKPRTYMINIDLKHMIALAHSVALKLSLLLGVRRWSH